MFLIWRREAARCTLVLTGDCLACLGLGVETLLVLRAFDGVACEDADVVDGC